MKKLTTLLLVFVALTGPLRAGAGTTQEDNNRAPTFESELAAVLDAVNSHNPVSVKNNVEYLGAVYKQVRGGVERYGYTVGMGEPGRDTVTVSLTLPPDSELLAFWHTHGASHWTREFFSEVDTRLANDWRVPLYLVTARGELRVFQPGDPVMGRLAARKLGLGERSGYASGRVVRTTRPAQTEAVCGKGDELTVEIGRMVPLQCSATS